MNAIAHSRLELHVRGLLSPQCEVLRDGTPLTRTGTLYSPLTTGFALGGRQWHTRTHIPGGRGIDLLREIVVAGVLARGAYALRDEAGTVVASARERGLVSGGYTLDVGGEAAALAVEKAERGVSFLYEGPGGHGVIQHAPAQRMAVAALPASLPAETQVFVALLALRHWFRFEQTG